MLVHILCTYTHKKNDNLPMRGRQQGEEKANHNAVDATAGNTARSDSYLCRWAAKSNLSKSLRLRPETGDGDSLVRVLVLQPDTVHHSGDVCCGGVL